MSMRLTILLLCSLLSLPASAAETIVAFGDSITRGWPYYTDHGNGQSNGSYIPTLQALLNAEAWDVSVRNYGIPGEIITNLLAGSSSGESRLDQSVMPNVTPDYVLIMEGTNDLPHGVSPSSVRNAYFSMIADVRADGKIPLIGTLLPRFDGHGGAIPSVNQLLKDLATSEGVQIADLYNVTNNWPAHMQADLLHPNLSGYALMANPWFTALLASRQASNIFPVGAISILLLD